MMKYFFTFIVVIAIGYGVWTLVQTKPDASVEQAVVTDTADVSPAQAPVSQEPVVASKQASAAPAELINNASVTIAFKGFGPGKEHTGGFSGIQSALTRTPEGTIAGKVTIDMSTLSSDTDRLTTHLKSPDFFDVVKYPTATFVVTSAPVITTGTGAGTMTGNLTVHGVTKKVSIPYRFDGLAKRYTSTFTIDMKAFGISQTFANEVVEVSVIIPLQ